MIPRRWILLAATVTVSLYAWFGVRGWLGVEESNKRNQDDTYWAAVYSRSKLWAPFMKTYDVLVPSSGDLNSHPVFETYGFRQNVGIRWLDSENLAVVCRRCNQTKLLADKIDKISVHLITQ